MLKTDLYSAIKSEDSEALDSGTSQLGSQRGFMTKVIFHCHYKVTIALLLVICSLKQNTFKMYCERSWKY